VLCFEVVFGGIQPTAAEVAAECIILLLLLAAALQLNSIHLKCNGECLRARVDVQDQQT
jgi:hypothetical protein